MRQRNEVPQQNSGTQEEPMERQAHNKTSLGELSGKMSGMRKHCCDPEGWILDRVGQGS